ncbi:hypothetical protein [Shimia sediminis]|uniref:hypothetical protein n=1 Tax=Shimia sediminis TaxID=2497945 RepID=UPI000F8D6A29|nr:hypothetical protein [Shimia sediminis]
MKRLFLIAACALGSIAHAEDIPDYATAMQACQSLDLISARAQCRSEVINAIPAYANPAQNFIRTTNCTDTLALIDDPTIAADEGVLPDGLMRHIGQLEGIILGYEMSQPGIEGPRDSLMDRLRQSCEREPGKTVLWHLTMFGTER